ncbi:hypothetical protein PRIPAC_84697 [Pristionchus pacificus]|uniref:Uncharacterized protein n=1 Tax=Pristionchus pacificus TaxID=54126 RepID=A0A8R1V2Z6_PRIPA|nr:hypothetical protein PRIPAC_84697 [Pristionchus pacificus]
MPSKHKLSEFAKDAMQATADSCKDGILYDDEATLLSAALKEDKTRLKKFVTNKHYYEKNKKIKEMLSSFGAFQDNSTITPDLISKVAHDSQAKVSRVENILKRVKKRKNSTWSESSNCTIPSDLH